MTMGDLQARNELVLGGICQAPKPRPGRESVEIETDLEALHRLARHWRGLPEASRPRLRGISVSRTENGEKLVVVLDAGNRSPFLVVTAGLEKGKPVPSLSGIWPHAAWWESELREFSGIVTEGGEGEPEARWLRH